jgi:hypothetical protein
MEPAARDEGVEMITAEENLSLHQESIESLASWRPKKSRLEKVKDEDFGEIAKLLRKVFVENEWFSRMWVVQVSFH